MLLSPNQTPYRDMYFLEKLVGIGEKDGVQINAVFTQLFFIMGIWPAIYAALLIPSARSGNKVPAMQAVCAELFSLKEQAFQFLIEHLRETWNQFTLCGMLCQCLCETL